jgi:hypothetical protein
MIDDRRQKTEDGTQKMEYLPFSVLCFLFSVLCFLNPAFASDTIVTHEIERLFYKEGRLLKLQGQYEMTYYMDLDKDMLTRTRIYDFLNDKITPDETVYHLERQLLSHPTNADRYILTPVVRAVGQTSADTLEMLVIEDKFAEAVTSSSDELVISRARRIR